MTASVTSPISRDAKTRRHALELVWCTLSAWQRWIVSCCNNSHATCSVDDNLSAACTYLKSFTTRKVAIAMHYNLRPPYTTLCILHFNWHVKFEVSQPIRSRLIAFSLLISYVTLWPWRLTCDLDLWPLTLKICSILAVTWSNYVPNLSEIEQLSVELLWL